MAIDRHVRRAKWTLTPEAFDTLLAEFDPDPARAGARYEEIRRTLTFLFERRGCPCAADLADETFDRVARKVLAGEQIRDLPGFFYGVARYVIKEYWHDRQQEHLADANAAPPAVDPDTSSSSDPRRVERMEDCLDHCMARLAPDQQTLMIAYYQGEKGAKIRNRKRFAEQLGVSMNVLSLRAFRIRAALRACVTSCLEGTAPGK